MRERYRRWIYEWESRMTSRDNNRVVRPFEWGLDWTRQWPSVDRLALPQEEGDAAAMVEYFAAVNDQLIHNSDEFFAYKTPSDFQIEHRKVELFHTGSEPPKKPIKDEWGKFLRFTSPVPSPYQENNRVNARWFPANGHRAVVLLPQWNADGVSQNALCRLFNVLGIAALRLSMPYHDIRRPKEITRADYAVSANVGRTIDAARQAVIDVRCCLDWLEQQGYSEFGVLGTSLGSCYAFLASAHDERLRVNVFNHASTYFADVVWIGQSTRHIRAGVESAIDLENLRRAWTAISPTSYVDKFARAPKKSLVIYAKYDLTFPPQFSRMVVEEFKRRNFDFESVELPCGHYTTGETPFKFLDGYHIVRYMVKSFRANTGSLRG
jgi:dienelactone hydrolase